MSELPSVLTPVERCRGFKFRVKWDGRYIPEISRVMGLTRITEVVEFRDEGDPNINRKSAGTTRFEPITLERGLTDDRSFEEWADLVWMPDMEPGCEASVREFRKNVEIELYSETGELMRIYLVRRSWPSEYRLLTLDESESVVERMRLENEGWGWAVPQEAA